MGGVRFDFVEIPGGNLGVQIPQRAINAHCGNRYLNENRRAARVEAEERLDVRTACFLNVLRGCVILPDAPACERPRKLAGKKDNLILRPRLRPAPTDEGPAAGDSQIRVEDSIAMR